MDPRNNLLVVDASVVVKWFITGEVLEAQAVHLYAQVSSRAIIPIAPDHIFNEVASAITYASRGDNARLAVDDARLILSQFLRLELRTVHTSEVLLDAFDLVHRRDTSIYDSMYLALSDMMPAPLITADANFFRKVNNDHNVLWLGEFESN